jgi:hypothetical protein
MKKTQYRNYFWKPILIEDMTKTLLLQVGVKFMLGQDHRTLGNSSGVHPFIGGPSGLRIQEMLHGNNSTPIPILLVFFMEVI